MDREYSKEHIVILNEENGLITLSESGWELFDEMLRGKIQKSRKDLRLKARSD